MGELDRVLGGGLIPGSVTLLGGEPGIGKSTLLLQLANQAARVTPTLYLSAEESAAQIGVRARRLGVTGSHLRVVADTDLEAMMARARDEAREIADRRLHPDRAAGIGRHRGRCHHAAEGMHGAAGPLRQEHGRQRRSSSAT